MGIECTIKKIISPKEYFKIKYEKKIKQLASTMHVKHKASLKLKKRRPELFKAQRNNDDEDDEGYDIDDLEIE